MIFATILFICSSVAMAQLNSLPRTLVSTKGADTTGCGTQTSPCRTFGVAINQTVIGGEVIAIDSGIYDTFDLALQFPITLSAAPGVHAELGETDGDFRLTVNAPSTAKVAIRNLILLRGASGTGDAIFAKSVGILTIENCTIDGYGGGIDVELATSAHVSISNTTIRNGEIGAYFSTSSGTLKVMIDHCRFENFTGSAFSAYLGHGVAAMDRSRVFVTNSTASGNDGAGFFAGASGSELQADNCQSFGNRDGFLAYGGDHGAGLMMVSNSAAENNSRYGFGQTTSALFYSEGNNTVRRNTTNTSGTITVVAPT